MIRDLKRSGAPSFRRRMLTSSSTQTEASFFPSCASLDQHYEKTASEQFQDLCKLRDVIRGSMREMACSVYDVVAFKDVLFKIEDELPSQFPVTDMLLISSKLFRRTTELGRLLGCFFSVVFAEEHCDEHFKFTEVRVLRREIAELRGRVTKAEEERSRLQRMLDDIGRVAMNHSRAVDLLESRNAALQLQTTGLEDQMALLFGQLNKDFLMQCDEAYDKVSGEIDAQDRLSLTKATFRQTIDSLSDQLRNSRTLINEVRELVNSCSQGYSGKAADAQIAKEPSIRFKLKQVENNFQQLIGRFTSIKGIVAETAHELMSALQERKNILYLSLQHIRLYDIQNTKMRHAKAIIIEMKRYAEELLRRIYLTFPSGAVTFVDRIGRISTQQWQVGQTLATIRGQKGPEVPKTDDSPQSPAMSPCTHQPPSPGAFGATSPSNAAAERVLDFETDAQPSGGGLSALPAAATRGAGSVQNLPFETVYNATDLIKQLDRSMENLNRTLNFENEINAFLKTLTLSLSTTAREVDNTFGTFATRAETFVEKALLPTGDGTARFDANESPSRRPTREGNDAVAEAGKQETSTQSPLAAGTVDPRRSSNIDSEAQASLLHDQERKVARLQEQLDSLRPDFASKIGFLRQVYEARISDLEVKEAAYQRRMNAGTKEIKRRVVKGEGISLTATPEAEEKPSKKGDKEQLINARSEWQETKRNLQANKKVRETALGEISKLSQGKGIGRSSSRHNSEGRSVTSPKHD